MAPVSWSSSISTVADRTRETVPEERWAERWSALRPHLEGHLVASGSSLPKWLRGLEAGGDARLAGRLALLGA